MKKILPLMLMIVMVSCKKDKETLSNTTAVDSANMKMSDSLQNPSFSNPDMNAAFQITPQNIASEKGRTVFSKDGKVLFYFDQNSNNGNINIDGVDYALNTADFNENNYKISGSNVSIEATEGDFPDTTSDCISGEFPQVKVSVQNKIVNLTDVKIVDCPVY